MKMLKGKTWQHEITGSDGNVILFGVNIFDYEWENTHKSVKVRIVKRIAPYTEITDHIISAQNNDYLQKREWIHKEYISASCLKLKVSKNYKLV